MSNTAHTFHYTVNVRIEESEVERALGEIMQELKVDHNQAMGLLKNSVGVALQEHTAHTFKPIKHSGKTPMPGPKSEKAG